MKLRIVTIALGIFDALAAAVMTYALVTSIDPATGGLDRASGAAVLLLFAVTGLPALVLAWRRLAPRTAFVLALAFPVVFAALFVAVVIAFA